MRVMILALALIGCTDGGGDDDTGPSESVEVELGEICPRSERIAVVEVMVESGSSAASFQAQAFDVPHPWFGDPTLDNGDCAYHTFDPGSCGTCGTDEVCGHDGACHPVPRADPGAVLTLIEQDGTRTDHEAVEQGAIWGNLDGTDPVGFELTLSSGDVISLAPTAIPSGALGDLKVTGEGDYDRPGELTASWTAPSDGGMVGSEIPINHHAGGPTMTTCLVDASAGSFTADAEMVDPLAVSTGLEFQGVRHLVVGSARLEAGCVDVRYGRRQYVDVQFR